MLRNPRGKSHDKQRAAAAETPSRQLLVWRTCSLCDWEGRVVETEHTAGTEATCPQCHAVTEVVAMAPVPEGGVPGEKDAVPGPKRRELAFHKRARRSKTGNAEEKE